MTSLNNLSKNWEDGFGGGMSSYKNGTIDRVKQMTTIQNEAKELFKQKNADYGDAFADYGTVGVLVRMGDKIRRLQSITNKGINLVKEESLRDTLIDLHNYSAMAIMLLDEEKEKDKEKTKTKDLSDSKDSNPMNIKNIIVSEAGMGTYLSEDQ
tara:strand:- start:538 stop:999 length:462 start_codon:yes stop_codon:yes gene_type:complete